LANLYFRQILDRNHQQRSGQIVRLNDKTVTLHCGQQQWRVGYSLLHRIVDSSAAYGETLEFEARDAGDTHESGVIS
jgi:hypothetical protein